MTVELDKEDLEKILDYMENSNFVAHMNNYGLSFPAMGFILTTLSNECNEALTELGI